ncbi:hypothetical protein JXA70_00730 [candidate division KSB1 bacterium]|nr:hypothetical protein [candidate division KSB1 bacterium]
MNISREEAEKLIDASQVLSTSVNQQQKQIQVRMELANAKTCIVTYDRQTHQKSYQIDN